MYKPKLTIVDSELRDMFAAFVAAGMSIAYSDNQGLEEDKDEIARISYEVSDALVKRRKINKKKFSDHPSRED